MSSTKVLAIKFGRHVTPDFGALGYQHSPDMRGDKPYLDSGDVAHPGEVHPIGFVQLGPDQVVQIANLFIFSHERRWIFVSRAKRHPNNAPVRPSLAWTLKPLTHFLNMSAGTT